MKRKVLRPDFEKRGGLVAVVAQDVRTGRVLMVASTDEAGYLETLKTGKAVYYSTSRQERWMKGETSGDYQIVKAIAVDCDGDALIYFIEQLGDGACHTKALSCFYRFALAGVDILSAPKKGEKEGLQFIETEVNDKIPWVTSVEE